jgi:hypothetical protein
VAVSMSETSATNSVSSAVVVDVSLSTLSQRIETVALAVTDLLAGQRDFSVALSAFGSETLAARLGLRDDLDSGLASIRAIHLRLASSEAAANVLVARLAGRGPNPITGLTRTVRFCGSV